MKKDPESRTNLLIYYFIYIEKNKTQLCLVIFSNQHHLIHNSHPFSMKLKFNSLIIVTHTLDLAISSVTKALTIDDFTSKNKNF